MRKKYICLILTISFLVSGIECRRGKTHHENLDEGTAQNQASTENISEDVGRGKRRRQAAGKGYGLKASGRQGRRWGQNDAIELSSKENQAIEIETVKASFQP